jgi:hypothetical protein
VSPFEEIIPGEPLRARREAACAYLGDAVRAVVEELATES